MLRPALIFCLGGLAIGCLGGPATAAIDESCLPAMYQVPWNPGIPGGIPADNDPVRPATVWLPSGNPYHGYSVNPSLTGTANAAAFTASFQAAINAAGAAATPSSRRIVLLKAGTYYVNPQVNSGGHVGIYVKVDNVTIRGEGADTTHLAANGTITDYGTVVLFGHRTGSSNADFAVQNVTANALQGSTTIQVANASVYSVSDVITIDHQDGPAVANGGVYFNGGYLWFYDGQYFKRQPTYDWNGPSTGAPAMGNVTDWPSANTVAKTIVPQWRSTSQETAITAINGNTITINEPLYTNFSLSSNPQVWRTVPLNTGTVPVGNRWCGIENIAVAGGNNMWGFPGGCVVFSYMAYSWAKNIEADGEQWSSPANPAHPGKYGYNIGLGRCYRCVIRDSYAHGSTDIDPGGQAYGIVVGVGSANNLVENNISVYNDKPVTMNCDGGGNVIAYNYVDEAIMWSSPGWQESAIDDCHANFTHHDLIEGNWTANLGTDSTHGNSGWHTHFRNYSNGTNLLGGAMSSNLRAVEMTGWTHYQAFVGNVLKGGAIYQRTSSSQNQTPIYQIGTNCISADDWDNGYALAHIYRDANWDNVTNGVVWASGSHALPASLYLASKPAFFGSNTWPWVEPTTGSTYVLPAFARYYAGTPNTVYTMSVAAYTSTTWVYQNTPVTTLDRHAVALTVSVADTWGNSTYTVSLDQTGPGVVTPTQSWVYGRTVTPTGNAEVVWTVSAGSTFSGGLVGGRVSGPVNGAANLALTGSSTVTVKVAGNVGGTASATVKITVRPLGGLDSSGPAGANDRTILNKCLNDLAIAPQTDSDCDLTGDLDVTTADRVLLNKIVNGLAVP